MPAIPNKVKDRLVAGIKKFQPILAAAKSRDINESDTVVIITDLLADLFGYDKYSEITSEYAIRGTYVDLAIKLDGRLHILIEVKAIGQDMKEAFIKQAVDYGANQGVDWVVLTTGIKWHVYKIKFGKPIEQELVLDFDFLELNHKNEGHLDNLYLLTKEGVKNSLLGEYQTQREAMSRYSVAATLLTDPVLDAIRRELKKLSPDVKIDNEQIQFVLVQEVLKREVLEGDKADSAKRRVSRVADRQAKKTPKESAPSTDNKASPASITPVP